MRPKESLGFRYYWIPRYAGFCTLTVSLLEKLPSDCKERKKWHQCYEPFFSLFTQEIGGSMKFVLALLGLSLLLVAAFLGIGGNRLPDWCGTIANAIDGSELVAINNHQVQFPLGGDLNYPGNMKGLRADHDTQTHRVFNVHPECGNPETMVQRAIESGVIKPAPILVGLIGLFALIFAMLPQRKISLHPSLNPA